MPFYVYHCPASHWRGEVYHPMRSRLRDWGELCYVAQIPLGDTPPDAPVVREISAPAIAVPASNRHLKELGFTKLVRRDEGIYENVTALSHENRYVRRGRRETLPDLKKRIHD